MASNNISREEVQDLFRKTIYDNGDLDLELINGKYERKLVQQEPAIFKEARGRLLTAKEYADVGYSHARSGVTHNIVSKGLKIPVLKAWDPLAVQETGFMHLLIELRGHVAEANFKLALNKNPSKNKGAFNVGATVTVGRWDIQQGPIARLLTPEVTTVLRKTAELATAFRKIAFPGRDFLDEIEEAWFYANSSITYGHENNRYFSTLQVNMADLDKDIEEELGTFGMAHIDNEDLPAAWTVDFNLSIVPEGWFPGRIVFPGLKIACDTPPFSVIIFKGGNIHHPYGPHPYSVPEGSPLRYTEPPELCIPPVAPGTPYQRITLISYTKSGLSKFRPDRLREEMFQDSVLGTFGTVRHRQEWWMRVQILKEIEDIRRQPDEHCSVEERRLCLQRQMPDFWTHLYAWEETDSKGHTFMVYPRRIIAAKALRFAGKVDPAMKRMNSALEAVRKVSKFPKFPGKTHNTDKAAEIEWTHEDYVPSPFDSKTDTVPGNLTWNNGRLTRAEATLLRIIVHTMRSKWCRNAQRRPVSKSSRPVYKSHNASSLIACEVRETAFRRQY